MEFKNFTLNCFQIPNSNEYIGMFKIKWLNGINTRIEWTVFCDDDSSQEGVTYNSYNSSNVHFSANLSINKNYCVVFGEFDAFNTQLARTWGFVKGCDVFNALSNTDCVLSNVSDIQDYSFSFGSRAGILTSEFNFGDWNNEGFKFDVNNDMNRSGWIYPQLINSTPQFELPALTEYPFNTECDNNEVNSEGISCVLEVKDDCNQPREETLEELIQELQSIDIVVNNNNFITVPTPEIVDDREDWEIELDKIIEELEAPLRKKNFNHDSEDKLVLVENYLGEKYIDDYCVNEIPIPPPLPTSLKSYDYTSTKSFKDELQIIRRRVTGRSNYKIDEQQPKPKKRGWFSLFR